ncbi:MAG: FISUMP domain-containing protein, partial [Candidatus Cryptobacteroides sp.]
QDEVEIRLNTLTHPEDGTIGYAYSITEGYLTTKDTLEAGVMSFKYKFSDRDKFEKDTLRTVSISAYAFADGYYSTYASSKSVTIVKGGIGRSLNDATITGIDLGLAEETLVVDGITYYTITKGGKTWLRRNLVNETTGLPYLNTPAMLDVFGTYHDWESAKTACPDGYHLPTDQEWVDLCTAIGAADATVHEDISGVAGKLMANALFNGEAMWTYWPEVKITDESKMSIFPTGYANIGTSVNYFDGAASYAVFWTADEYDADNAYCRQIYERLDDLQISVQDKKSFGASVRCVKD